MFSIFKKNKTTYNNISYNFKNKIKLSTKYKFNL